MKQVIEQAIENRHLLEFYYKDEIRVIEPYTLGINNKGNVVLSGYQVSGGSSSSSDLGWRLFTIEQIERITTLEETFSIMRTGYNPNDSRMSYIYKTV